MDRHPFIARREDSLVLVIDIQQAMLKIIDDWEQVAWKVSQITRAAEIFHIPVLVTEQYPKGLGPTIPQVLQAIRSPEVFIKELMDRTLQTTVVYQQEVCDEERRVENALKE